jgi:hypothetical protein
MYPIKSDINPRITVIVVIVGSFAVLQITFVLSATTELKTPLIDESAINKIIKETQINFDQYDVIILFSNTYPIIKRIRSKPNTPRITQPAHTGNNPIKDKSTLGKLTVSTLD